MEPAEVTGIRNRVRSSVMHELDMTDEIRDEDVSSLIDRCIIREMSGEYIPLKEKLNLKSEIFNSIRRMDVLSDLLQDDEITEIMIICQFDPINDHETVNQMHAAATRK